MCVIFRRTRIAQSRRGGRHSKDPEPGWCPPGSRRPAAACADAWSPRRVAALASTRPARRRSGNLPRSILHASHELFDLLQEESSER
ncbi:hypothetical protein BC834DRAFT_886050 [Gloeopeniophorella convolvens]|nr:hypothetical protein BC834DRAFT_886050 [Gloeopeniophorella convolvens]